MLRLLDDPASPTEQALWSALSEQQRARAVQRALYLKFWEDAADWVDVGAVAADAGLPVDGFRKMSRRWRSNRSLTSLDLVDADPTHADRTGKEADRPSRPGEDAWDRLAPLLKDATPSEERDTWAVLSEGQRTAAAKRIDALARFVDGEQGFTGTNAAIAAGVSATRFYQMAKAWRARRSLASVGVLAVPPRTRVFGHAAALEAAVRDVVDRAIEGARDPANADVVGGYVERELRVSVRSLAMDLAEASGLPPKDLPSYNTLRKAVDDELRRRRGMSDAGRDVAFDCTACSMLRSDGKTFTIFAVVDVDAQFLLGAALGEVRDSRAGHAAAAEDALRRLEAGDFTGLPWVERMARAELVVGHDVEAWADARQRARAAGVVAPLEPATARGRFGRYLAQAAGARIGTIGLWPARTDDGRPLRVASERSPRLGADEALARLRVEVNFHNAGRRAALAPVPERPPPADLRPLLDFVLGG